jgi:hypothetical protein
MQLKKYFLGLAVAFAATTPSSAQYHEPEKKRK